MRVSEMVTVQEINSWKSGSIVTIKAPCGAGKSYFIKNILYAIARRENKKILMLIHRKNCVNQFLMEIKDDKKTEHIDIKTYQSIEAIIKHGGKVDFSEYEFVVCDEFHWFMGDSNFNKYTDLSLDAILSKSNATRIFMSATGDYMKKYINHIKKIETIDYELPDDFGFIRHLEFYHQDATLHRYINLAIQNNKKVIFFLKSAKKAYELYRQYKDHALFNCSEYNKDYYKYVDEDKIKNMLKNNRFDELILFTTTVFDAGVNIKDDELHDIVIDVGVDLGVVIQCIGRKRLQYKGDYVNVHIKSINNNILGGIETQLNKRIEMARYFDEYGEKKYVEKYYRQFDRNGIVYDEITSWGIEKRLNKLMYFKVRCDIAIMGLIKAYGEWGYCKYVTAEFGLEEYTIAEEESKMNELEVYLNTIADKLLFKEEREELIKIVGLKDNRGRIQKSISLINEYFKSNKINFAIVSKSTKVKNEKGEWNSARCWVVLSNIIHS